MSIARPISDYRTLVETFRARADELGLSRAEIDRLSGLPDGYSGRLLGRAAIAPGVNKQRRRMLPTALDSMLGVLGLRILFVEDEAATARTIAMRVPVNQKNQRFDNKFNAKPQVRKIAAPANEPAPMVSHLRVIQGKQGRRQIRLIPPTEIERPSYLFGEG
jgi:hypothetical protein